MEVQIGPGSAMGSNWGGEWGYASTDRLANPVAYASECLSSYSLCSVKHLPSVYLCGPMLQQAQQLVDPRGLSERRVEDLAAIID